MTAIAKTTQGCCQEFSRQSYYTEQTELFIMEGEGLHYYDINSSRPDFDEGLSLMSKLLSNGLYGKFGQKKDKKQIVFGRKRSKKHG